ncbi:coiled-coil domain-containing protein [Pseudanabaena minima]|uniref:coiled-coil domain-containing protein n=1 Tax=Pseudanabaena minima TaxID=890415 RepID=UPI003DA91993
MTDKAQFIETIYSKVNELLGGSKDQLFSMLFPAQPLNYRMYQYDTSSNTSLLTKPFTIAENEFRLSDQLFSVNRINTGPNGERLSVVYNTAINNFIPKLDYLVPFIRDRAGLGNFLEEPSGEVDVKTGKSLSRIELCKQLYVTYLEEKNVWNEKKTKTYESFRDAYRQAQADYETARDRDVPSSQLAALERTANDKANWLDEYAKWQSSEGMVGQEKLNNLYNDVVVRGKLHEVMTILGYLNASSIAEELEVTKQRMRNSARSSLDESMTVYPVQFQPNNWFKALTPNLNPADLTMAQDSIRDQLMAKQTELSRAKAELAQMDMMDVKPEEIAAAQQQVDDKQNDLKQKEQDLSNAHGKAIADLATLVVKAFPRLPLPKAGESLDQALVSKVGGPILNQDQLNVLTTAVTEASALKNKQEETTASLAELQSLKAKRAQLDSRDWKFNKSAVERRVQELTGQVEYYSNLLAEVQGSSENKAVDDYQKQRQLAGELLDSAKRTNKNIETVQKFPGANALTASATTVGTTAPTDPGDLPLETKADPNNTNNPPIPIDHETKVKALNNYVLNDLSLRVLATQKSLDDCLAALKTDIDAERKAANPNKTKLDTWTDSQKALTSDKEDLATGMTNLTTPPSSPLMSSSQTEADAEVNGMFQDIVITSSTVKEQSSQNLASASSSSKWAVSGWFFSASGQSNSSSSTSTQETEFYNQDIEIGLRVAKVSFDRGGWFNPAIFKMSNAFYHLAPMRVSGGLAVSDLQPGKNLEGKESWVNDEGQEQSYLLPAFPVAMIIAKDVTIRIKTQSGSSKNTKSVVEKSTASGGGLFCFSASSGSASKSSAETAMHGATSDGYYIRIPGPQILGYYLQFVPKDNSLTFSPATTKKNDDGESEIIRAFDSYRDFIPKHKEEATDDIREKGERG